MENDVQHWAAIEVAALQEQVDRLRGEVASLTSARERALRRVADVACAQQALADAVKLVSRNLGA